jgi:hypothetical protein
MSMANPLTVDTALRLAAACFPSLYYVSPHQDPSGAYLLMKGNQYVAAFPSRRMALVVAGRLNERKEQHNA